MQQKVIELKSIEEVLAICGENDENISILEENFPVTINYKDHQLYFNGSPDIINKCVDVIEQLLLIQKNGKFPSRNNLIQILESANNHSNLSFKVIKNNLSVYPKTAGQETYFQSLNSYPVVFCIGPAGTGKTYIAVAKAISELLNGTIDRIILSRPVVEAGESLGFLPGDIENKIYPYLRPLYDALHEMIDMNTFRKFMENDVIEIAPLAYMRGRTLNNSCIILDEAQNTTITQMQMFLTRMGRNSTIIIAGDKTQIDIPYRQNCGLIHAENILKDVKDINFCYLHKKDVVRHSLVQNIIDAYEKQIQGQL